MIATLALPDNVIAQVGERSPPRATYRLQMTKNFTFRHAAGLAPYLARLGISHAYLSPILKARRGSTHGYDTVDHTEINPELGTRQDFEEMAQRFQSAGIGILLDIVPNHMGIGGDENPYWLDVLKWGRHSQYADWFDINWSPAEPTLRNKVLAPYLGSSFGEALENGSLELCRDPGGSGFSLWAENTHRLPISPSSYSLISGDSPEEVQLSIAHLNSPSGRGDLAALIEVQHWRLARFSVAADDINYRRFFIVSDLAAIRVEREAVFDHVHRLIFELIAEGLVQGLRVDHIDGLYDPKAYCLALREKSPKPIYLVVEKILAPHELLRVDWGVDGTTGYEFAGAVTRLLADAAGDEKLSAAYAGYAGGALSLADIERDAKRGIIDLEMAAELDSLTVLLRTLAAKNPRTVDVTRNAIRTVLREMVAAMPVYRTYVDGGELNPEDERNIQVAAARARLSTTGMDPAALDFLSRVMTGEFGGSDAAVRHDVYAIARRIQQYTGPVMAKGLEDTALYRYNRLIALSDVGEKPDRTSESVQAFHDFNLQRQKTVPDGMLTSSSHDSKRGEDSRARIVALTGFADEWTDAVTAWTARLKDAGAPDLDPNDQYYFFQLLLGSWPTGCPERSPLDIDELKVFAERIKATMLKSAREARLHTNWNAPQTGYESALMAYLEIALDPSSEFLQSFRQFEASIGTFGAQNGLIETVLKLTVPGVPDFYQGSEFWEQSMVDPDNRRPVDFDRRQQTLQQAPMPYAELIRTWRDGRIKQRIIADLLACRRQNPVLFANDTYVPVLTGDPSTCAFLRRSGAMALLVAVRLRPWRGSGWGSEPLPTPDDLAGKMWHPLLGDRREPIGSVTPSQLFAELPVAAMMIERH